MAHVPNRRQTPPLVARTDIRGSRRLGVPSVDSHWKMEAVPSPPIAQFPVEGSHLHLPLFWWFNQEYKGDRFT